MTILYHTRFEKRVKKLSRSDVESLADKIEMFADDPFNIIFRNHALHGIYDGYRSIDIKGNLLALYKEERPDVVRFCYLGTHHELYGK